MRTFLCIYLLLKSLFGWKFNYFDIDLAKAMRIDMWWPNFAVPSYVEMIANLTGEEVLPEAWADFKFDTLNRGWLK